MFTTVKRNEVEEKPKKEFTVRNVRPAKQVLIKNLSNKYNAESQNVA